MILIFVKNLIRRGKKLNTTFFDRSGHETLNFIMKKYVLCIFHTEIDINCEKCIRKVISINSQFFPI